MGSKDSGGWSTGPWTAPTDGAGTWLGGSLNTGCCIANTFILTSLGIPLRAKPANRPFFFLSSPQKGMLGKRCQVHCISHSHLNIISVQNSKLSYALAELQLRKAFCIFKTALKMFLTGRTSIFEVQRKLHLKAMAIQTPNGILTGNSDL